eukprot:CAMPEP_0198732292 /NCGR_PEP_ID=MMETSP1475-20131203/34914_1 /TAXON_ID= ORGANISM="Unidentified sp., Strain CCMP1999" /NCGR_SAMPLE_ID=MMETSP1475 /ASSEMBLY_ACC=CAM_ASM_001111 /LENGTH=306 /DNA_ID=CAMNT_0044495365 /DNA_START=75 /DNA_END=995 /DNA_ORIENTATION=+
MSNRQFKLRLTRWNKAHKRRKTLMVVRAISMDNLWTDRCARQKVAVDKDVMFMLNDEDKRVRVELRTDDSLLAEWEVDADRLLCAGTNSCTLEVLRKRKDLSPIVVASISPMTLSARERMMYLDLDVNIPDNNRYDSIQAVLYRNNGEIAYTSEERGLKKLEFTNRPPFGASVDASTKPEAVLKSHNGVPLRMRKIRFHRAMVTCYKDAEVNSFALKLFAYNKDGRVEIGCAVLVGDVCSYRIAEEFPLCYGKYDCGAVVVQQRERSAIPKYLMLTANLHVKPRLETDQDKEKMHIPKSRVHIRRA